MLSIRKLNSIPWLSNYFSGTPTHSATRLFRELDKILETYCSHRIRQLNRIIKTLDDDWEKQVFDTAHFVRGIGKARQALQNVIKDLSEQGKSGQIQKQGFSFLASSLFIIDCCRYLVSDPHQNERLHLVSGPITSDGTIVLSWMEKIELERQSKAYVRGNEKDAHEKIVRLDNRHGHLVLGMFHSHMAKGKAATYPSETDNAFLKRMAKAGCVCLAGIFSIDGYVRFFLENEDCEIEIYGKGVIPIENDSTHKIFRITDTGDDDDEKQGIQNKDSQEK